MQKWELLTYISPDLYPGSFATKIDPSILWRSKDKNGKTALDKINEIATAGWEPVSVTPININENTHYILYTFKRPREDVV